MGSSSNQVNRYQLTLGIILLRLSCNKWKQNKTMEFELMFGSVEKVFV